MTDPLEEASLKATIDLDVRRVVEEMCPRYQNAAYLGLTAARTVAYHREHGDNPHMETVEWQNIIHQAFAQAFDYALAELNEETAE